MTKPISILFSASLLALGINAATAAQPTPAQSQVQGFLTELSRAGDKPLPVFMFFHGGG
jgi:acetyl esterase/lipase